MALQISSCASGRRVGPDAIRERVTSAAAGGFHPGSRTLAQIESGETWPTLSPNPMSRSGASSPTTSDCASAFFDETADFFDRFEHTKSHRERQQRFFAVARQVFSTSSTERRPVCLDLGCGPGGMSLGFAAVGFETIGVDSSAAMIERADRAGAMSGNAGRRCRFVQSDLNAFLKSFQRKAALIVSSSVFEYLEDPTTTLGLVADRLERGGFFAVSVPNRRSLFRRLEPALLVAAPRLVRYARETRNRMDAEQLVATAKTFGLDLVEMSYFGQSFLTRPPIARRLSRTSYLGTLTLVVLLKQGGADVPHDNR
jgi:predicted TPR repeat methyltransferase